jgi:hypothetical protein
MAAYAVIAHIGRVDPHLALHDLDVDGHEEPPPPTGLTTETIDAVATVESERVSDPGPFAERLTRMRELWRQTTFYLFDAESWRA